jgi:hypothetical protein
MAPPTGTTDFSAIAEIQSAAATTHASYGSIDCLVETAVPFHINDKGHHDAH